MRGRADDGGAGASISWPAEWSSHEATWLIWPHNRATWPGKFPAIAPAYARFVESVARYEPVRLLATGAARDDALNWLGADSPVTIVEIPTNDSWIRDCGPTFLAPASAGRQQAVDWRYNAWGGKYSPYEDDAEVAGRVAQWAGAELRVAPWRAEGGALDGNGDGVVLTTESCLLNPNRNRGASQGDLERCLCESLGAETVIWLPGNGLEGDDTDGHIDQLARFVSPDTIVAAVAGDPRDANAAPLEQNLRRLRDWQSGNRSLNIVPLPTPRPRWCFGRRLPCSYCNFYFVNGAVLAPVFDDPPFDERALRVLSELLPGRDVVPVPAVDLAWGLGTLHCLSQQQPGRP